MKTKDKFPLNRYHQIDLLKAICTILVVLLHVKSPWQWYIMPITRCAVPVFFIISGYFLFTYDNKQQGIKLKKQIPKLIKIIIWSSILFAIPTLYKCFTHHDFSLFNTNLFINFVLFNKHPFGFHLWYLLAYLYVLLIVFIFSKYNLLKYLFWIIPILLICDLIFGKYSLVFLHRQFNPIYVRNFLFVGLPYFLIGMLLKKYELQIRKITNKKFISYCILGGILLFIITSFIERDILEFLNLNSAREHYISTTFISILLFISFMFLDIRENSISMFGRKDSLYVYIFHPIFMIILPILLALIGLTNNYIISCLMPFLIIFFTIIASKLIQKLN